MELDGTTLTTDDADYSKFTNAWNDISGTSPDDANFLELENSLNNPSGDSGAIFKNKPGEKTNGTHENHVDPGDNINPFMFCVSLKIENETCQIRICLLSRINSIFMSRFNGNIRWF